MEFDILRKRVEEHVGEKVLYLHEVVQIAENLGSSYTEGTIRNHLKDKKIDIKSLGINPARYGLSKDRKAYSNANVWNYLKDLENKGKLQLTEKGFTSLNEILENQYHIINLERGGSPGRRVGQTSQIDESEGSWSDVVRSYEEQ